MFRLLGQYITSCLKKYSEVPRAIVASPHHGCKAVNATSGLRCWVGDARGEVGCLDLKLGAFQQVLRGIGGAVASLAIHPSLPYIASAGLDRHLRIHDTNTRKPVVRYTCL